MYYTIGSDEGEFYPFISSNSILVGYSDGMPFMSANKQMPTILFPSCTTAQDTNYCIYSEPAEQIAKDYYSKVR